MANVITINGKNRKLGWKPDLPDYRDFKYAIHRFGVEKRKLPTKVDLRDPAFYPEILDQGDLGSCTGFGVSGCCDYIHSKLNLEKLRSSQLFIYYNERLAERNLV